MKPLFILPTLLALASFAGCSTERGLDQDVGSPGENTDLGGETRLRGRVTDQDGQAVANLEMWLLHRTVGEMIRARPRYLSAEDADTRVATTRTDAEGRYSFDGLGPRKWWVGIAPVGIAESGRGEIAPIGIRFKLFEEEAGEAEEEGEGDGRVAEVAGEELRIDLQTHRGLELRGKVTLPDGKPAADCTINAQIDRLFTFATVETDERGAFVVRGLAPGNVWLQASRKGGLLAPSDLKMVSAGDVDLVLELKPAGAISGSIVDRATRQPVPATLYLTQRGAEPGCTQQPGRMSEFRLEKLPPGLYDLAARSDDGRVGVARGLAVQSEFEERGVAIELEPGAPLTLKYERRDAGASFRLFSGEACLGWISLQEGQSLTQTVPPGTIRVVEMRGEGGIERTAEAAVGKEATVVFVPD